MHYTLSVKCSEKTKQNLNEFFEIHPLIQRFKEYGVIPNPSWFFKFSASVFLKNMNNKAIYQDINLQKFAYNCHYVNNFDDILESVLKK